MIWMDFRGGMCAIFGSCLLRGFAREREEEAMRLERRSPHERATMRARLNRLLFSLALVTGAQCASPQDDWTDLITPGSLVGWHTAPGGSWEWRGDVLVGRSAKSEKRHGLLISDARYQDFEVRFEFRTLSGCSGFYFRVDETGQSTGVAGFQAEIDPSYETGGLYETGGRGWVSKPDPKENKKWYMPREWNEMVLSARGHRIVVIINGHRITELRNDTR
ncbi:MAG: DUF1080 domain-containing protein, partial [Planctomycetota bacterium]